MPARIALAHDWLCGYRGGEAVLDRLAKLVGREHRAAGLFVMTNDRRPLAPAIDALSTTGSFLTRLPGGSTRMRRWLLPLYPRAVGHLSRKLAAAHAREPIDLVLSTSSAAIKGLRAPEGVPHICYCHSPARYIWSMAAGYAGGMRGFGLRLARERFRAWDRATAANVTEFVANSRHTAREIERCYGRPSTVVQPPVRTEYFTPDNGVSRQDFWLCVGALEPYKRVEMAIVAAGLAGKRLIVVGAGSHGAALRRFAGPETSFEGRVSDERLRELYRTASVLLFPQIEDFGIVAVEAQACGLPVVCAAAGGALDIVEDGVTGEHVPRTSPETLSAAAERVSRSVLHDPAPWAERCRRSAERFSEAAFDARMSELILSRLPAR